MDETLIHTSPVGLAWEPAFRVGPGEYPVYKRPGVDHFLESVLELFPEVAIWSAGMKHYVREVMSHLVDLDSFTFIWPRSQCVRALHPNLGREVWMKDWKKLRRKGYDLESVIFVDDSPHKMINAKGSIVPIEEYRGAPDDNELARVLEELRLLAPDATEPLPQ